HHFEPPRMENHQEKAIGRTNDSRRTPGCMKGNWRSCVEVGAAALPGRGEICPGNLLATTGSARRWPAAAAQASGNSSAHVDAETDVPVRRVGWLVGAVFEEVEPKHPLPGPVELHGADLVGPRAGRLLGGRRARVREDVGVAKEAFDVDLGGLDGTGG